MKSNKLIGGGLLIGGAYAIYLFFKSKNSASTTPITSSSKNLYASEETAIKASDIVIPATAVVLPTASSVVQSSVIQEEDINSLDCATLFLKYDTINRQLVDLVMTEGVNGSNVALLKNRKALIENVMKNKNCVVEDKVLESAIVESKIIAPTKYTNAELTEKSETAIEELIQSLKTENASYELWTENAGQDVFITRNNAVISRKYSLTTKLNDFLKTLSNKQDVDKFMVAYPILMSLIIQFAYLPQREDYKKQKLSSSDLELLSRIGYKDDFIS
jgi:hypothetical protein